MANAEPIRREIRPRLIQRKIGGWLATSPPSSGITIGVDAPTKEEAIERFRSMFSRWLEILSLNQEKVLDVPKEPC